MNTTKVVHMNSTKVVHTNTTIVVHTNSTKVVHTNTRHGTICSHLNSRSKSDSRSGK